MFAGLAMERWHIGPRIYMQDISVCQTANSDHNFVIVLL